MTNNLRTHTFTPTIDGDFIVLAIAIFVIVIIFSWMIVRINPINSRVTRYNSAGNKARKVANPRRTCGAPPRGESGLAIILPSTSFDWCLSVVYAVVMAGLVYQYHGAGIIQLLWNANMSEKLYAILTEIGVLLTMSIMTQIIRLTQCIAARVLLSKTTKEAKTKLHVYEAWGIHEWICAFKLKRLCRSLNKEQRRVVRAKVRDMNVSEKVRLDHVRAFVLARYRQPSEKKKVSFVDRFLSFFVEEVAYEK